MKKLLFALLLWPLLVVTAHAELHLEPPEALLKRAQISRAEAREVILDLQQNISEFVDPKTFDSYLYILDDLQKIADEKGVNEIYPNAVRTLGQQMVANGIRWLTAGRDPIERILYYHKWMNAEIAASFLSNVELEEKTLSPEESLQFAKNLETLIPYIDATFPHASALRLGYRTVLSERAARVLGRQDLTEEERLFWLSKLYNAAGFSSALNLIQDDVLHLTPENKARLHVYVHRYLTLAKRLLGDSQNQPFWLVNLNGDTAQIIVMRGVFLLEPFSNEEFKALLGSMQANDLQTLTQTWVTRLPKDEGYLNDYLRLTNMLVEELRARELTKEANEAFRFYTKIAAPTRAKDKILEGTYLLKDQSGKEWVLTAAFARGTEVFIGLADKMGFVNKSFFFLSYVEAEDAFIASERERTEDPYRNWAIKFKMKKDGTIEVRDLSARPGEDILKGKKTESFPNYFTESSTDPVNPGGRYEGIIGGKKMVLTVTAYTGATTAQMSDADNVLSIDLNVGTFGTDRVLYLTTGNTGRTAWLQLRGVVTKKEYRGTMIKGGKGIVAKEFVLKKVSE